MKVVGVLAAVLLAACGTQPHQPITWHKDGGNQKEYEQDVAKCEYEVSLATQTVDTSLRGGLAQEIDRSLRRNELAVKCMRARGYSTR